MHVQWLSWFSLACILPYHFEELSTVSVLTLTAPKAFSTIVPYIIPIVKSYYASNRHHLNFSLTFLFLLNFRAFPGTSYLGVPIVLLTAGTTNRLTQSATVNLHLKCYGVHRIRLNSREGMSSWVSFSEFLTFTAIIVACILAFRRMD